MSVTMVVPFPRRGAAAPRRTVALRPLPERPVLALVDNGKPKAGVLLEALGRALRERGAIAHFTVYRKQAMVPVSDAERAALLAGADAVVSGVGDCGGCTACSVTDALRFRELGVPSAVLVTTAFTGLAAATESSYGLAGVQRLTVEHPVWNRDPEWFAERGAELAEAWLRRDGPDPAVEDSLRVLRSTLEADGYGLQVDIAPERVRLRVVVTRPDACADCLVPADLFGDIAHGALQQAGVAVARDRVLVEMPTDH